MSDSTSIEILSPTATSLCNQMVQKFETIVAPLNAGKRGFRDKMSELTSALKNTTWSLQSEVDAAVEDLKDQVEALVPEANLSALEDLKRFIDNCELFSDQNPVSALIGSVLGIFDKIDGILDDLGVDVPEMGLGFLADAINKILNGALFPGGEALRDLFALLDIIINCLSDPLLCGNTIYIPEIDEFTDTLNGLMSYDTGYNLDDTYNFSYDVIFGEVGMTQSEIDKFEVALEGVETAKSDALGAVEDSKNAVKAAMKIGELF